MNERELRVIRALTNELRALRQEIHARHADQQAANTYHSDQPIRPIQVEIQTAPDPHPEVRKYYEAENSERNSKWRKFKPWIEAIGVVVAVALLIFNLLTLLEIRRQTTEITRSAAAAQQQIRLSTESFRIDERARIEIELSPPHLRAGPSGGFRAIYLYHFSIKNVGKTVAYGMRVRALPSAPISGIEFGDNTYAINSYQDKMLLGKFTNGPPESVIGPRRIPKTLGPGLISPVSFDLSGVPPQMFASGTGAYEFLIGRIDYEDAFDVAHWLKYCYFVANSQGELQSCREGNDEDRNSEIPN